ncbi:MAG: hypothetical protein CMO80_01655 [Verrucomicrobiales bacterium]|nr:hypothetical protein [Verrucomicrobiales bacterium]|tara:strand:- start:2194 stop:3456 length:1263 start_codon:yes stop_codon:yes gene_type:complete
MKVNLAYGQGHLEVDFPADRTVVIEPSQRDGLVGEKTALLQALQTPVGSEALLRRIKPTDKICILFTDLTRATPNDRIIPWILEHLQDHPKENIILLNQLGTHRPNTKAELEQMLTPEVVANYTVLNHDCDDEAQLIQLGETHDGTPALINRRAVEADLRIVTGFIEPHFFAGFSGGPKGIMPGVAGLKTVMSNHGHRNLMDPNSTFGINTGNRLWEELRDIALRAGPSFLVNVTLNEQRAITNVFAGDLIGAHAEGCEFVRESSMQKVKDPFDIVVTTNSGYPLDLNLYQGVKGMSAAARIVKDGGLIILACECSDGVPADSPFDKLLRSADSAEEVLALLSTPGFSRPEQWQAQIQGLIQRKAEVRVHSSLSADTLSAAHLSPCSDISAEIDQRLEKLPADARIAVLPQGPLTIPYLG